MLGFLGVVSCGAVAAFIDVNDSDRSMKYTARILPKIIIAESRLAGRYRAELKELRDTQIVSIDGGGKSHLTWADLVESWGGTSPALTRAELHGASTAP